jgi:ArsR family transcriptional regulator
MAKSTDPERLARALKALAHPSRLAAVRAVARGERCVCELQEVMGSDLSTVSRHLKTLADAGVIECRRQGQKILCRLAVPCMVEFLECLGAVLAGRRCRLPAVPGRGRGGK